MSDEQAVATPTIEAPATTPAVEAAPAKRAKQPVEAKVDARDSILIKHLEKAGIDPATLIEESTPSRNRRGVDGKFTKADSIDPPDIDTSTLGEKKETPKAEAKPKHADEDVRKAVAALQRYGTPKAVLKLAESGDDETIAHGLKLAKIQSDSDTFSKDHSKLQRELDEIKKKPAANSGDEKGKSATAATPELDAAVKPLADYLADVLVDDTARDHVRNSLQGLVSGFDSQLKARDQQIAKIQEQVESAAIDRARDALISEYPDLKDKEVWTKVRKHLDSLPESEDRPDILTRLEHAARIELAPELIRRAKSEQQRRDKARDAGQPTPPVRAGAATGSKSGGSLQDQLADAYERDDQNRIKELRAEIKSLQRST